MGRTGEEGGKKIVYHTNHVTEEKKISARGWITHHSHPQPLINFFLKRNKFLAQKAALEEVKDKFNEIMNLAHSM